jgi:hypothetical protein
MRVRDRLRTRFRFVTLIENDRCLDHSFGIYSYKQSTLDGHAANLNKSVSKMPLMAFLLQAGNWRFRIA